MDTERKGPMEETEGELLLSTAVRGSISVWGVVQNDISSLKARSEEYVRGEKIAEAALERVRTNLEILKTTEGDDKYQLCN